ncbi:MAG: cell envelope integrity protein CreD, partial [Duncaniella sp.]|nr:cell envelope integrity protein CreD [Duncaniella sp.]
TGILLAGSDSLAIPYNITMKLRGSRLLGTAPVGRRNEITISGECKSPSFTGMFLPSEREVKDGSFTASWTLNSTNRDYPQAFIGDRADDIAASAVMVDMLVPVDRYQKTDRALKYAIIVILLTFIAVLFAEIMMKHPINMFQYLLIGLALILFYSLLLSLSEHLSFGLSYLIASVMTIGLVAVYMRGVLKSAKIAMAIGALLTIIYVFIYILLCLETFALLTGSLGLFIALAAIMYATLKLRIENKE